MGPIGKKSEDTETIKMAPPMVSDIKIEVNVGKLPGPGLSDAEAVAACEEGGDPRQGGE